MNLTVVTPPAAEPASVSDAKMLLRIETDAEDTLLASLLTAARLTVEAQTGRALITQTWRLTLDRWPNSVAVELPRAPLQAIESITLVAPDGTTDTWSTGAWLVETAGIPGRLVRAPGVSWPAVTRPAGGIRIAFTAGYGDEADDVPADLRHAILLLAAHWFENRVPVVLDAAASSVPSTVAALIAPYRMPRL